MKNIKYIFHAAVIMLLFAGCQKYDDPAEFVPVEMQANTTIQELQALYTGSPTNFTDASMIVAGVVVSDDKEGNHYRSIFIQDATGGIEVKIGRTTLYNTYKMGQTIYIRPYHNDNIILCLGAYGGMISIGAPSTNSQYQNSWIDAPAAINSTIFRGAYGPVPEPVVITSSTGLNQGNVGKLVSFKGLRYDSGEGRDGSVVVKTNLTTWAVKDDTTTPIDDSAYGQHIFYLADGSTVMVRTSGYAKFADTEIDPSILDKSKTVNITGVLTYYSNTSTYQLVLNTDKEVVIL